MYKDENNGVEVKVVLEGRFMPRYRVVKSVRGQQVIVEKPLHDTKEQAEQYALSLALR